MFRSASRSPVISAIRGFLALALFACPPLTAGAQQRAPLRGVVADAVTGMAIPAAGVVLVGTALETRTGADGTFALSAVPAAPGSVRVEAPGYAAVVQQFDLTSGDPLFIEVFLPNLRVLLQEILVAAPPADARTEARTAADLVAERVPGMFMNTGIVGLNTGPIVLRGVTSISLSSEPVIYLDGVRLRGGRGQAMDALSKIPAAEIRQIRILRGPASTLAEGSANGVIYVETKSGPPPGR